MNFVVCCENGGAVGLTRDEWAQCKLLAAVRPVASEQCTPQTVSVPFKAAELKKWQSIRWEVEQRNARKQSGRPTQEAKMSPTDLVTALRVRPPTQAQKWRSFAHSMAISDKC